MYIHILYRMPTKDTFTDVLFYQKSCIFAETRRVGEWQSENKHRIVC